MAFSEAEQKKILASQVEAWTAEIVRLAGMIGAARQQPCAVVLIEPKDEGYEDVAPELIMEDALRVDTLGWPKGFSCTCLNRAD